MDGQLRDGGTEEMKLNLKHRLSEFQRRTDWLSDFTNTRFDAVQYQVKSKFYPDIIGTGHYNHKPLHFRKGDLQAMEEVLVLEEYDFIASALKSTKSPIVLDIGAHIGTFALWCLKQNVNSKIISLEADPETYKILSQNQNSTNSTNWTSINKAAWSSSETLSFRNTGATMSHKVINDGEIKVEGISFEKLMDNAKLKTIDILKIDIEGAEEAFLSAKPELLKNVKNLIIEIHPQICDEQKINDILNQYFDTIENRNDRQSSKPLLWCRNKTKKK